jgi:arylsulfatase A-like enzyme
MMTGWYPHTAGHRTLTHLLQPHEPNLLRLLRDAGYHVAWAGVRGDMFADGVTEASTDFSGFLTFPEHAPGPTAAGALGRAFYTGRRDGDPTLDLDEANLRTAIQWLAGGPPEPWVLFVAQLFPHPPFEVEEPWFSLHDRAAMPRPIPPDRGGPGFRAALRQAYRTDELSDGDWAEIIATYYGMVSRIDDQFGRLLDAVDAAGFGERTSTWFFTDHGEYLGDFGLVEKWPAGLEPCLTRNPLIGSLPGAGPQRTSAVVELVDLLPTLLELAGGTATHTHFGQSLVPLLTGATRDHRPFACSEGGFSVADEPLLERATGEYQAKSDLQHEQPELVGKATALRTRAWTFVHRLYESDELYDRRADPQETTNLIDAPDHASTAAELRGQLLDWLVRTSDVIPWDPDPRFAKIPHGHREATTSD